ncbi:MAG TPA: Rho termination factor N-terminal domain-containing protein [Solirubrobacteraceae bacterium]
MSILDRDALEDSPLADLHAIASALSIDGYRRLRRVELIDAILTRQGGARDSAEPASGRSAPVEAEQPTPAGRPTPPEEGLVAAVADQLREHDEGALGTRRRRGRRGRARPADREESEAREELVARDEKAAAPAEPAGEQRDSQPTSEEPQDAADEPIVEGVVELLPNGSGFLRVNPPETSDDDVYISAAQVKRCELVPGDRISGPRRPPRRSERFASLIRIDTINDRPADDVVVSTRFDELSATFPQERFRLGSEDPTVKAIEWLTPFGRGSRVTIVGPPQAGKTEALRRLATALSGQEGTELSVVLVGVRPEELAEWAPRTARENGSPEPATALSFDASADAQSQAVERIVDRGRRLASRGADAVLLIDSLDGLAPTTARKALHSARKLADGGSLTVIATATIPVGGETTVIALDRSLASAGRFPALDLSASWTMHADRLVGEVGAEAIATARAEALGEPQ